MSSSADSLANITDENNQNCARYSEEEMSECARNFKYRYSHSRRSQNLITSSTSEESQDC